MAKRKPKSDEWLAALLPPRQFPWMSLIPGGGAATTADTILDIPLDDLDANPYQTRSALNEKALNELCASIQAVGLLEPIVVRPAANGRYQVVAGERRVKACYMSGMVKIHALVRQISDQQAMEMTLVENLLREDVNTMDQARAFERLAHEFGLSLDEIAARTGKSRSAISNFMRLLHLPPQLQEMLRTGKLSFGHAKALLALSERPPRVMLEFAQKAASLSVRATEKLIEQYLHPVVKDGSNEHYLRPRFRQAEQQLHGALGVRVIITERNAKGSIRIPFDDLPDLDRIVGALTGK